ncbi:MAG: hypothetical protein IJT32_06585, partial [Lachnospiraceae bacterium]|nr:hypothetical protein [Lachnospiraceae bacterium]
MNENAVTYNRSGGTNYMILEGDTPLLPYEEQMLSENTISSLLSFHIVRADTRLQYWYDITGGKSVRAVVEREGLTVTIVRQILSSVEAAYRALSQYLITEEKICIDPDTVFLKRSAAGMEAKLCFFPNRADDREKPIVKLTEYFISVVDHSREDVTRLCYALYEESLQENATVTELLRLADAQEENAAEYEKENANAAGRPAEEELLPGIRGGKSMQAEESAVLLPSGKDRSVAGEEGRRFGRQKRRKEEEDFWAPADNEITMDDVFADSGEEDEPSIAERIGAFFTGIPGRFFGGVQKKKEEIFPPKDLEEDLIYDPHTDYSEPTVLLSADADSCFGKLIYEGKEGEQDYMIDSDEFSIGTSKKGNQAVLRS